MFCFNLGQAAVDELFYSRFTFNLSFFFRFSTWKWLLNLGNHATISSITISNWIEFFWFAIALLLYWKSAILGLSFLDAKDLCLQSQFSKVFCRYILNLMSKKKLSSFNDWINAYFQSFICLPPHNMNIFWPESLSKFSWRFWTEFSQSWNSLRKTLRSHECCFGKMCK